MQHTKIDHHLCCCIHRQRVTQYTILCWIHFYECIQKTYSHRQLEHSHLITELTVQICVGQPFNCRFNYTHRHTPFANNNNVHFKMHCPKPQHSQDILKNIWSSCHQLAQSCKVGITIFYGYKLSFTHSEVIRNYTFPCVCLIILSVAVQLKDMYSQRLCTRFH